MVPSQLEMPFLVLERCIPEGRTRDNIKLDAVFLIRSSISPNLFPNRGNILRARRNFFKFAAISILKKRAPSRRGFAF